MPRRDLLVTQRRRTRHQDVASFKAGHAKIENSGRKRGVPNKLTADIKEAIVVACTMLGGSTTKIDPEEVEGLVGYMVRLALHEPTTMGMLLRAALPLTLNQKQAEMRDYLTEDEVRERLAALGMPWQTFYQLEHHSKHLIELEGEALEHFSIRLGV
jgi:hypothetical protein